MSSSICNPMDYSLPGSSVCGISQARILSGLPFPTPGDLPSPGNKPTSSAGQADSFTTESSGKHTWFKIEKEVHQGCILSPCLFNLYAEHIMWNAGLDESQGGIKTARKNINNLRYADDTTLAAESEEELKSLLMKVKEDSEKAGLKLNIQKTKIMASGPITSWHTDGETMEKVTDFTFLDSKITADDDWSHEIKRCLLLGRKAKTNLDSVLKAETLLCQQRSILSKPWFFQWSCMDVRVGP